MMYPSRVLGARRAMGGIHTGVVVSMVLAATVSPAAGFTTGAVGGMHLTRNESPCSSMCLPVQLRRAKIGFRMAAEEATDATFREVVLESKVPTLVSFWAPWCGPCRMIKPVLEQIEEDYNGKLKLVQMNTDENPGTATEYGIRSIPTLMLFKGGDRIDTIIGAVPKATLESKLAQKL